MTADRANIAHIDRACLPAGQGAPVTPPLRHAPLWRRLIEARLVMHRYTGGSPLGLVRSSFDDLLDYKRLRQMAIPEYLYEPNTIRTACGMLTEDDGRHRNPLW